MVETKTELLLDNTEVDLNPQLHIAKLTGIGPERQPSPEEAEQWAPVLNRVHFCGDCILTELGMTIADGDPTNLKTARAAAGKNKYLTKDRSAHHVGFGWLKEQGIRLGVALKPFNNSKFQNASNEALGYLVLDEFDIATYNPIGIFPSMDGQHTLVMTEDRPGLRSLDREDWVVGRKVVDTWSAMVAEMNTATVEKISEVLGFMHSNGIFHPDGQIKNFAMTSTGEIGVIDTEHLRYKGRDYDADFSQEAFEDIEKLVKSLIYKHQQGDHDGQLFGVGMLYGMSTESVRRCVRELILDPYLESLLSSIDAGSEDHQTFVQKIMDGVCARFDHEQDWPSHVILSSKAGN